MWGYFLKDPNRISKWNKDNQEKLRKGYADKLDMGANTEPPV